jgi:hypothetical protein
MPRRFALLLSLLVLTAVPLCGALGSSPAAPPESAPAPAPVPVPVPPTDTQTSTTSTNTGASQETIELCESLKNVGAELPSYCK